MALLGDPRGLFMQALLSPLVLRNFFFGFFIFVVIHYGIIWMTGGFALMPPLMMYNFIVRMLAFFGYGAISGYFLSWSMGHPPLIASHDFDKVRAHPAPMITAISIVWAFHQFMYAIGATQVHAPFPGSLGTAGDWFVVVAFSILFLSVFFLTWTNANTVLSFSYLDLARKHSYLNAEYILMLVLVLGPQAIWDFFPLAPPDGLGWLHWQAAILTLGIEVVVWIAVYLWFLHVRHVDETIFTPQRSLVTWMEYVIIVGVTQLITGAAYAAAAEFLVDLQELGYFLLGTSIVIIIESVIIYFWLRRRDRAMKVQFNAPLLSRSDGKKPKRSGSDTEQPTHRRSNSDQFDKLCDALF